MMPTMLKFPAPMHSRCYDDPMRILERKEAREARQQKAANSRSGALTAEERGMMDRFLAGFRARRS